MTSSDAFFLGSQIYDPVALLRRGDEILCVARVGMKGVAALHDPEVYGRARLAA